MRDILLTTVGILLQFAALCVIVVVTRRNWKTSIGLCFLFGLFVYHGLIELLPWITGGESFYRFLCERSEVPELVCLVGGGLLLFSITYSVIYIKKRPRMPRTQGVGKASGVGKTSLNATPLLIMTVPCYLTVIWYGYLNLGVTGYWVAGVVSQFTFLLMPIATAAVVMKVKMKRPLLAILVQILLISLVGSRALVLLCLLPTVWLLWHWRVQFSVRQLASVFPIVAVMLVVIFATRDTSAGGRRALFGGLSEWKGTKAIFGQMDESAFSGFMTNTTTRLDGNSHATIVWSRLKIGQQPVGPSLITPIILLNVPRAIFPEKLESLSTTGSERVMIVRHFGLPETWDFPPTTVLTFLALGGVLSMPVLFASSGFLFALWDRYCQRVRSISTSVLGVGLMQTALLSEGGLSAYVTMLRGAVVVVIVLLVADRLSDYLATRRVARRRRYHPIPALGRMAAGAPSNNQRLWQSRRGGQLKRQTAV